MLEAVLVDGSRLGFDANRTWIRSPVSRSVRDISWAPTWWVLDLLEQEKIGGLVRHSSEWDRYQEMLDGRTHKPFGALRAPVDASDLMTHLCKQLEAFGYVRRWREHMPQGGFEWKVELLDGTQTRNES